MRKLSCIEMANVYGTGVSLPMDPKYRNKDNCKNEAARLIDQHLVSGMTQQQIQEEIFGHAVAYYDGPGLVNFIGMQGGVIGGIAAAAAVSYLVSHANPIDIEDGGDTAVRQLIFSTIWNVWPSIF
ncbi:MAG TPA: hypothetical protein H9761_05715 [Candidatus Eisenbergiella merdavium]|uniref:Uncharacterized protein n=1 Tax=Candidatus Eisenbergiella merdavium TaxID=2838551 RepID=A0A9D2ND02_9FIRM|nr:hypothetical protein [Candidatus Eisenbergiella merdavium]